METRLGKLLQVELSIHTGQFPSPLSELTWRHERRFSGNNTMAMGIYYEALERWIGPAATVAAMTRRVQGERKDPTTGLPRSATVPDLVQVQGLMKRDRAFYRMSFSDASGFAKQSECILHGSEAALKIPLRRQPLLRRSRRTGHSETRFHPGPGWRVEEEFVRAIRGEEKVCRTTFADGLSYMKWTDAVHASAKTSRVARIAP